MRRTWLDLHEVQTPLLYTAHPGASTQIPLVASRIVWLLHWVHVDGDLRDIQSVISVHVYLDYEILYAIVRVVLPVVIQVKQPTDGEEVTQF